MKKMMNFKSKLTNYDIVYEYSHAANKGEQIWILSDLTMMSVEAIIDILKDAGVFNKSDLNVRKCNKCGKEIYAMNERGIAVCDKCRKKKVRR